jgi:hypothetical protein
MEYLLSEECKSNKVQSTNKNYINRFLTVQGHEYNIIKEGVRIVRPSEKNKNNKKK